MQSKICRDLNAFKPEELILIQREIDFATKIACGSIDRPLKPGESIDVSALLDETAHTKYIDEILPQVRDSNATGETELERDAAENYQFVKDYSGLSGAPETFTYEEVLAGIKTEQAKPAGFKKKEMALNIRSSAFLHTFALNPEIKDETKAEPTTGEAKPWNTPLGGAVGLGLLLGGSFAALWTGLLVLRGLGWVGSRLLQSTSSRLLMGGYYFFAYVPGCLGYSRFGIRLSKPPFVPLLGYGIGKLAWQVAAMPVVLLLASAAVGAITFGADYLYSGGKPEKSLLKKFAVKHVDPFISRFL